MGVAVSGNYSTVKVNRENAIEGYLIIPTVPMSVCAESCVYERERLVNNNYSYKKKSLKFVCIRHFSFK